jgi:hypothetical protein
MKIEIRVLDIIKKNKSQILKNIKFENISVYSFINREYKKSKDLRDDFTFQYVYRKYYGIDAVGLGDNFKITYFEILDEYRNSLSLNEQLLFEISIKLESAFLIGEQKSFQFSFITKLLNTINNEIPIWDTRIREVFLFNKLPNSKIEIQKRISVAWEQLSILISDYEFINNNNLLDDVLIEFDKKFKNNGLTINKKIDFLFWSVGNLIKEDKLKIR